MLVTLLLAAGLGGGTVNVMMNVQGDVTRIQNTLQTTINSTYYALQRDYDFLVCVVTSGATTYYALGNGTNSALMWYSTNKTAVQEAAIGNLTASAGTVYLKDNVLNSSLTYGANVTIIENYNGAIRYYGKTGIGIQPATFIIDVSGGTYRAWHGANSTLFTSSTNATSVFNFAYGNLTSGGKIFVREGTFLANNINTKSFVECIGSGIDVTTIKSVTNAPVFLFNSTQGTAANQEHGSLQDMTIDGSTNASDLIYINQTKDCLFRNLKLKDFAGNGFNVGGISGYASFYNRWENIEVGIGAISSSSGAIWNINQYVSDNYIEGVTGSASNKGLIGIKQVGGTALFVDDFHVDGLLNTVVLHSDAYIDTFSFTNSWIDVPTGDGIVINVTAQSINYVTFQNIGVVGVPSNHDVVNITIASGKYFGVSEFSSFFGTSSSQLYNFEKVGSGTLSGVRFRAMRLPNGTANCYHNIEGFRVIDDQTYVTSKWLSGTNTTATTMAIAHTLAGTPSSAWISLDFTGWTSYSWSATTTTITVTVTGTLPA